MGRGVVQGRVRYLCELFTATVLTATSQIYTQQGNLVAVLAQEGVVRADLEERPKNKAIAKL